MSGYVAIACYVFAMAATAFWFLRGRRAVLERDPTYVRALRLLDRAEALSERRMIEVTAPTRACRGFYSWDKMLPPGQVEGLRDRARAIQAESTLIRREMAEVVMQAGHLDPWRRSEAMHVVHMAEDASGPDFIVDYGYEGQACRKSFRVPVMSVYVNGRGAE